MKSNVSLGPRKVTPELVSQWSANYPSAFFFSHLCQTGPFIPREVAHDTQDKEDMHRMFI